MSSIIKSLSDVFTSLLELVWSFFTTAGELVQKTASFGLKFVSEVLDLLTNFFRGLVDLAGGIVGFVLGMCLLLHALSRPGAGADTDARQAMCLCWVCLLLLFLGFCSISGVRARPSRSVTRSSISGNMMSGRVVLGRCMIHVFCFTRG